MCEACECVPSGNVPNLVASGSERINHELSTHVGFPLPGVSGISCGQLQALQSNIAKWCACAIACSFFAICLYDLHCGHIYKRSRGIA